MGKSNDRLRAGRQQTAGVAGTCVRGHEIFSVSEKLLREILFGVCRRYTCGIIIGHLKLNSFFPSLNYFHMFLGPNKN